MPAPTTHCPECGGSLPANTLAGLCPRCVARSAGFDGDDGPASTPPGTDPSLDSLLPLRPDEKREFVVESEIARGGMGIVFAAQEPSIGRRVVLKFLRPERETDATALNRFLTEARITGQLEHPAIVPVYHLGVGSDGRPFYAMRHIRGESLATILDRLRSEEPATVALHPLGALLGIFQKICDAVAYAHSRGVVHRDLKPDNIMLGPFGEVVVMDWGLAKVIGPSSDEDAGQSAAAATKPGSTTAMAATLDETVMGTLGFMAPEQAEGRSNQADQRTDIYALGAILYAMLTLRPPIRGTDPELMLDRTRSGDIRPPSDYNPGARREVKPTPLMHCPGRRIPQVLSAIAMKALALRPADRYQAVTELQRDITAYVGGFATSAEQAGWARELALLVRRHKTVASAVAALLLLTAGFMTTIVIGGRTARRTLANLRSTAPTYVATARSLMEEQKFEAALEKISFAVSVAPDDAQNHLLQGHILEALQRFAPARNAYAEALRRDSGLLTARENRDLCAALVRQSTNGVVPGPALWELHSALMRQGRGPEALFVAGALKGDREQLAGVCRARLAAAGIPGEKRLTYNEDELNLDLEGLPIVDLSPLSGMPLTYLRLSGTTVEDLTPLKGMPLRSISMHGATRVHDLAPLRNPQLREIQMGFTQVRDLAPLKGSSLALLIANNNPISDLSPLRGMALEELAVGSTQVADLAPLGGMISLKRLNIGYSQVTNLAPITGLLLNRLQMESTRISDLAPLRGMPLIELFLHDCRRIKDLSPLTNCVSLQRLTLPTAATNIAVLRNLPALQSIHFAPPKDEWTNNAAEFWKTINARSAFEK